MKNAFNINIENLINNGIILMNIKEQEIIEKYLDEAGAADYAKLSTSELKDLLNIFKNVGRSAAKPVLKSIKIELNKRLGEDYAIEEAKVVPFKKLEQAWTRTGGDKAKQAKLIKKHDLKRLISSVRPGEIKLGIKNKLLGTTKAATAAGLDLDDQLIFVTNNPLKIIYPKKSGRRPEGEEIKESNKVKDVSVLRLQKIVSLTINEDNEDILESFISSANIDINASPSKIREAYKAYKQESLEEASDKDLDIKSIKALIKKPSPEMIKKYGGKDKYIKMLKSKLAKLESTELEEKTVRRGNTTVSTNARGVKISAGSKYVVLSHKEADGLIEYIETKRAVRSAGFSIMNDKMNRGIRINASGGFVLLKPTEIAAFLEYNGFSESKIKKALSGINLKLESTDLEEADGWIAIFKGKKLEITKKDAKDLWGAKQFAINKLKVPKSKQGLLAIKPAYNESTELVEYNNRLKAHTPAAAQRLIKKLKNKFSGYSWDQRIKGDEIIYPRETHIVRFIKKQPEVADMKESTELEEAKNAIMQH